MNTTLKKELPIILIALLPTVYLLFIWQSLPSAVPIHWNTKEEVDGYGSKAILFLIILLFPCLVYIILQIVPTIDLKAKLSKMGSKLQHLKFLLTTLMSLLAMCILYSVKTQTLVSQNTFIIVIGIMYFILGNYFKTIPPNYFIGIRTPWALENETNWKETHKVAGKLWFAGGLLIVIFSLLLSSQLTFVVFISFTIILAIVPFIYSYLFYKKTTKPV